MRRKTAVFICELFMFMFFAAPASAKVNDIFLARMVVVKEVEGGAVLDYEVEIEGRGRGILKSPEAAFEAGDDVNFFVMELLPERGLTAYKVLEVLQVFPFTEGLAIAKLDTQTDYPFRYFNKAGEMKAISNAPYEISEGILVSPSSDRNRIQLLKIGGKTFDETIISRNMFVGVPAKERRLQEGSMHHTGINGFRVPDRYRNLEPKTLFSEGHVLALVSVDDQWTVQVIDKDGNHTPITTLKGEQFSRQTLNLVIDYGVFYPFSDGLGLIKVDDGLRTQCLYFNTKGQVVLPKASVANSYNTAYPFREGLAITAVKGKNLVAVNTKGEEVVDLSAYGETHDYFSDGMLGVREKPYDGQWAFINNQGKQITNFNYKRVFPFSDGLALVEQMTSSGSKFGYIDKNGDIAIPITYRDAEPFSEGLAAVYADTVNRSVGVARKYIDKNGNDAIDKEYIIGDANMFSDGLALLSVGGDYIGRQRQPDRYEYIDREGNVVLWFYNHN